MMWMKIFTTQTIRGSFEVRMNVSEEIRPMKHAHDIVEDTGNEAEAIDNNLDAINKELGYDNNISVSDGIKILSVKGRNVAQDLLIQLGTDEI
jgi:hypothetical protein